MKKFNFSAFYIRKPLTESKLIDAIDAFRLKPLAESDLYSGGFMPLQCDSNLVVHGEADTIEVVNATPCYQNFGGLTLVKYVAASRYPAVSAVDTEINKRMSERSEEQKAAMTDEDHQNLREAITYELGKITPITINAMWCAFDFTNQRCYVPSVNEKEISLILGGLRLALGGFAALNIVNSGHSEIATSLTSALLGPYDRSDINAKPSQALLAEKAGINAEAMDHVRMGACAHLKSTNKNGPEHKVKNVDLRGQDIRQHMIPADMAVKELEVDVYTGFAGDLDNPFRPVAYVCINQKWHFKNTELDDGFEAKWRDKAEDLAHLTYWEHDKLIQAVAMLHITSSVLPAFNMPTISIDERLLEDEIDGAEMLMNAC